NIFNEFQPLVVGYKNIEAFQKLIAPYYIVVRKEDVKDKLPPFTIVKKFLPHSMSQVLTIQSLYNNTFNSDGTIEQIDTSTLVEEVDLESIDVGNTASGLAKVTYTRMALADSDTIKNHKLSLENLSPKTKEIVRFISNDINDEKIVIYSPYLKYIEHLQYVLSHHPDIPSTHSKSLKITGEVKDREDVRVSFSTDPNLNVLILNDAGIRALNLQAANTLIVTSLPKTFGDLSQLAGRISRLGSKHQNLYLYFLLTKDSQDEDEYKICMQQGLLSKPIIGESEKGLIDYDVLADHKQGLDSDKMRTYSLSYLVLAKRAIRKSAYLNLKVETEDDD
ncbi:MAG: hypothetical protein HQK56_20295, partial [Deltaproteobacteria bacterium]|nr:hypothetical protein [Deltaproteobacteria bacterium]